MSSIVLASGNAGKIREIQAILQNDLILPQSQFQVVEPEETGSTFVENAIIKARNAARHCGLPAIADDSGLVVDALGGAPGVLSARYAGAAASDSDNNAKLLDALSAVPDHQRTARFVCVMVFMRHADDPTPIIAQGVWEGRILREPLGGNGFGYDPLFWVETFASSSAQLAPEQKNAVSHRGQALQDLRRQLGGL
ncbi:MULTISPECIES: RdgB/HAM1 family non-canonical purine NTP pyrophosphatase [Methylomonas]|uniref:dITP/XTP pyrophosphatase n=1 Tax=Methylomonas koyamae TaxID=702114 RepID=A0A177P318_9GAMM|nr:RdgB/HAM1 family non-canonical purine NTP pyrophosphatase [Methylomonas koyamae]OAI24687.1 non-canonical purine NTP pyrophosphatase [Methylomonas koyamae]